MKTLTTGATTSIRGIITARTAWEVHGTGAVTTTLGTTHAHGATRTGDIRHGTSTRGITEASTILGTTDSAMQATGAGMTRGTTCILTMRDGTADGTTHTGDTTITIIIRDTSRTMTTSREYIQAHATAQVRTGYSRAAHLSEEEVL